MTTHLPLGLQNTCRWNGAVANASSGFSGKTRTTRGFVPTWALNCLGRNTELAPGRPSDATMAHPETGFGKRTSYPLAVTVTDAPGVLRASVPSGFTTAQ